MTAALELPALEEIDIRGFKHQGGVLHLDQLTGSCPNIKGISFQLGSELAQGREGGRPCCDLLDLGQLASLVMQIEEESFHANLSFDLPASLTHFEVQGANVSRRTVDFFWWLSEAVKCIRRGAQLRKMTCRYAEAYLQPAQWGAQPGGAVQTAGKPAQQPAGAGDLGRPGAAAQRSGRSRKLSAQPSQPCDCHNAVPRGGLAYAAAPASKASGWSGNPCTAPSCRLCRVLLTLLAGCTRLREVVVHIMGGPR